MSNIRLSTKIFNKWRDDLHLKDRKIRNVENNFVDLFYAMTSMDIDVEEAKSFIKKAVIAHFPDAEIVKRTFSALKKRNLPFIPDSKEEFFNNWKAQIESYANKAFEECYKHAMPSDEERAYSDYVSHFKEVTYEEVRERAIKIQQALDEQLGDDEISSILEGIR